MIKELNSLLPTIPNLIRNNNWNTLLINKYPPIIHRLSLKISENRTILLHKLFNTEDELALMHSHSWAFACKVLQGGYEMGIGFSQNRDIPPKPIMTSMIKSGDIYEMTSPDVWHYTKPLENKISYSVLLIGDRCRERKAENNSPLSSIQKEDCVSWFIENESLFHKENI